MAKGRIRKAGASTGRTRQSGERYPSGKLKPQKVTPNPLVMARRRALCDDPIKASNPLDAAFANGWLSEADYRTGQLYAALRIRAGFGRRGGAAGSNVEVDRATKTSLDVSTEALSYFSALPNAEVAAIWDAVFDHAPSSPASAQERAAKATAQWRRVNAAMTFEQRQEVENVCVLESWPQWILQRRVGRMETSWEGKRVLLVQGLGAIRRSLRVARPSDPGAAVLDMAQEIERKPIAGRVFERAVYVDGDGQQLFEVERRG